MHTTECNGQQTKAFIISKESVESKNDMEANGANTFIRYPT